MPILLSLIARWGGVRAVLLRIWPGLAVVAVVLAGWVWLHGHDRRVLAARDAAVARREAPARDDAANARAADADANFNEREAYHDAIAAAGTAGADAAPDPADVALACERLRRAGIAHAAGC